MQEFKTESKRILELMIHSIYTNKEIFLRELISNASDAIDKLHFKSLTDSKASRDFAIDLEINKDARTVSVHDNGIGMTAEELENNLGTIAASGTLRFKTENKLDEDMIGQFGVGFYAAFMVADHVSVYSKAYGTDEAHIWTSDGADGYEITKAEGGDKAECGTTITLHLKADDEDYKYSELLSEYKLKELVTKYSDYIRYPIRMEVTKYDTDADKKPIEKREVDTLNSMVPLWARPKNKVKKKEYEDFYRQKFNDYREPAYTIKADIEGAVNYRTLLFIPEKAPYDYYSKDYQKGLKLYSAGVLIMDKCAEILPDYLGFIKGIVDSPDLSLNISREMLQQDRQLRAIATGLEKKILSELKKFLKNDRKGYEKMFAEYAPSIKFGAYDKFGEKKDMLKDLLLFYSSTEQAPTLLSEYVGRMKEGQEFIYYACGDSVKKIDKLPACEAVKDKGYEILYFSDSIDEFVAKTLDTYDGKKLKSVADKDSLTETDEEKAAAEKAKETYKSLTDAVKKSLGDKVYDVRLSNKMKSHAVCLTADGDISFEMERVFAAMHNGAEVKAKRVLELNPDHALLHKLEALRDTPAFDRLCGVLLNEALLMEGFTPDDPADFAEAINTLLTQA